LHTNEIQPQEFFLKPGYVVAHNEETIVRCVLGSCVAVTLYDTRLCFGGMNHFIWPRMEDTAQATVTYGDIAIRVLMRLMKDLGASPEDLEAQLFGGGAPPERFGLDGPDLGRENLCEARTVLERLGVPIVSEDVGGCKGRKLLYNTATNEAIVMKVDQLRATDWYEFGQDIDWSRT
jgi:chemotaxis protein CheD